MEIFCEDIQSKILSGVPVESLLNCKLVCKTWLRLLSNRKVSLGVFFSISRSPEPIVQLYHADYDVIKSTRPEEEEFYETRITKISLPPIQEERTDHQVIVGSCNGLVCLAIPYKGCFYDPVYICNPFTAEYTTLPRMKTIDKYSDAVSGFGYLPSTNEYKVVRIMYPESSSEDHKTLVQVYTLGKDRSSGWRNITAILPGALDHEGICADGSLYWKDDISNEIVAFDLADESFRVLPPPPCIQSPRDEDAIFRLTRLGGYLCLVDHPKDGCVDIWSFRKNKHEANKNCDDVIVEQDCYHDWSWRKDFSIEWKQDRAFCEPLALTKKNEVLVWSLTSLKCYDPLTKSLNVIIDDEGDAQFETFKGILHMNTLVSLEDLGEKPKKWVDRVSKKKQASQLLRKMKGTGTKYSSA